MEKNLAHEAVKILLKGNAGEFLISFDQKKRLMVGSAETCDVTIVNDTISPIHAVLEYHNGICTIYDMNSRLGTKVNGESTIKHSIKIGDTIELGAALFKVANIAEDVEGPPPVLPSLKERPGKKKLPPVAPKKAILYTDETPQIYDLSYPLSKDPEADFSEYIFEDSDRLYPIFNYSVNYNAVEVIILYKDKIISVDYIPDNISHAYMCGMAKGDCDVEYPYLAKQSRDIFLEMSETECVVHPLYGHKVSTIGGEEYDVDSAQPISLDFNDIVRFTRDDVQIFVRRTEAPPQVAPAPVFQDDPELRKYLAITLLLTLMFLGVVALFKVDKEVEKEKIPERIATILYKKLPKRSSVKKITKQKKKVVKKVVKQVKPKKRPPKKSQAAVKKTTANKKNKAKVIVRKKVKTAPKMAKTKNPSHRQVKRSQMRSSSKRVVARNRLRAKTKGRVDVYKNPSFTSSLNKLMAKGGSAGNFQAKVVSSTGGEIGVRGKSTRGAFKKANITSTVGSLSNATIGKLDQGSGVEGLVNKRTIGKASIPVETIVVGMDPNLIRQTLMQYLDQFRYCYQNALDASRSAFSGVVVLDFTIAASGRVSRANATAKRGHLKSSVQSCVVNVLRKIPFPAPPGGEIVEVRQPMNFYPKIK